MANFVAKPTIKFEINMTLTESEARALEALMGYGLDTFIKVFYQHMGKHYLEPHETGLISLFESRQRLLDQLGRIDNIKDAAK
jgi:hypothetical protein